MVRRDILHVLFCELVVKTFQLSQPLKKSNYCINAIFSSPPYDDADLVYISLSVQNPHMRLTLSFFSFEKVSRVGLTFSNSFSGLVKNVEFQRLEIVIPKRKKSKFPENPRENFRKKTKPRQREFHRLVPPYPCRGQEKKNVCKCKITRAL